MELLSEDITHHTRKTYKMDMGKFMAALGIKNGKIDSCSVRTPGQTKITKKTKVADKT